MSKSKTNKRELEEMLRSGSLPKSLLLYGACTYQIDYFGQKVVNIWSDGGKEEAVTFYFDDYDFSSVKNYLNQSSLFGDKNILIIKTQRAIPKDELNVLISLCHKTQNSYMLVQVYDEEKTKNMLNSFTKKFQSDYVRFFRLHVNEAIYFMREEAKLLHVNIQHYALLHLLLTHNENLSLAISELSKLSILEKEVTKSDIDRLVYGLGEVRLDDFISNLLEKKDIKKAFNDLVEGKEYDTVYLINSIQSYVVQLFLFNAYMKIYGTFNTKEVLGYYLPLDVANRKSAQCRKFDIKTYHELLKTLAFAEITIKKGAFKDKNTYLLSVLLKIQNILK